MIRAIAIILVFGLTLACSKEPKTVDYYVQHKEERVELLKRAINNPGKFQNDPDVVNALAAEDKAMFAAPPKPAPRNVVHTIQGLH